MNAYSIASETDTASRTDEPVPRQVRRGPVGMVFLDRDRRLRVAWRLIAYVPLISVAIGGTSALVAGGNPPVARNVLAHLIVVAVVAAITYVFQRYIGGRSWRDLGLVAFRRRHLPSTAAGFGLGAAAIVVYFLVAQALGWTRVTGTEIDDRGLGGALALLGAGFVMYAASAVVQELAFRGYVFRTLTERMSIRGAAIVAGVIFAVLHVTGLSDPLTAILIVAWATVTACFLVATRLATGALWMAIAWHTAWNWVQDDVFPLDTEAAADYGNALVHVRFTGSDAAAETVYLLLMTATFLGYWLVVRRWDRGGATGDKTAGRLSVGK